MVSLGRVFRSSNNIERVVGLKALPHLKILSLSRNQIKKLDGIAPRPNAPPSLFSFAFQFRERLRVGWLNRFSPLGGVPRELKMLRGYLLRVMYHQVY
jgi:Leucine-rich repeat (LRR) protein